MAKIKHNPEIVRHLYRQGFTYQEIIKKLNIGIATYMRYVRRIGKFTLDDKIEHLKNLKIRLAK